MHFVINRKLKLIVPFFFFSVLLILLFTSISHASWDIYKRIQIKSTQGDYLRFESINGKYIRLQFGLRHQDKGVFFNKQALYRIDGNDLHIIKKDKNYKKLKIKIGYYINWIIAYGKIPSKELREFMDGKEVVFQYYRDDGEIMEAVFLLDGIKETIGEILN